MNVKKWLMRHTNSLEGKKVAVSGATGGIGRELCAHLASLGASLVLVDRNQRKSAELEEALKERFPSLSVSRIRADMESLEDVKSAACELEDMEIDYLILNAGAYHIPRHTCDSGYNNVFQINYVSPYLLARALLPHISARGGRIIAVGSIAHNYSKTDMADLDFSSRTKSSLVYGNAKRHLMFSLLSLDSDSIVITHPGITLTGITAHYPKLIFALIKHPMKVIFMSPRRASLCILAGIFEDVQKNAWIGPSLFDVWGAPKSKLLRTCSEDERARIARVAEEIHSRLWE